MNPTPTTIRTSAAVQPRVDSLAARLPEASKKTGFLWIM